MAVLQLDKAFTAPLIPAGSLQLVIIINTPSTQAIIQGCVTTFFRVFILLLVSVKTERPEDHIMIL